MEKHNAQRELILPLLEQYGGVTEPTVHSVAQETGIPEADVWGAGRFYSLINQPGQRVRVCDGLTCQMLGADALADRVEAQGKTCERVSCLGQCDRAPAMLDESLELASDAHHESGVTESHSELAIDLAGELDSSYQALERARQLGADSVIAEIESSGLQGRGGAGFPAHIKWNAVRNESGPEKYVVCNADEGEPGTFKDREIMLRRPHRMIEGLAIAAYCVGASDIYVYIRGEFKQAFRSIEQALIDAGQALNGFAFHLIAGHGAYICGEETALLESLEGKRGMPRLKPPYPTESGFRGKPTLMHNVETVACVPKIVERGGDWFKQLGRTEPGTKLYCISGHVQRPGVYELPLGVTLDELVDAADGYEGQPMAFSPGGASSGFLPMTFRDLPLDAKHLREVGSMLGSSGVVVLNDTVDLAEAVAWQLRFFERESCGQCAPCRIGTQYLRQQVDRYRDTSKQSSLQHAEDVGWEMEEASICGLGMVAAKPLESVRRYFPNIFG